jgi:uncharacterized protein with HEPN domain
MSSAPREYLLHILAEADYLLAQSKELSLSAFQADETLRRAYVRSIEIIGLGPDPAQLVQLEGLYRASDH